MVSAELLAIYRACDYAVRLPGGARAVLRIGAPLPDALAAWMAGAASAAFITAYNPRSQPQPARINRAAQRELFAAARAAGARVLPGVGRLAGEVWREPSLFVAGLSMETVDALACRHSQNAVVLAHGNGQVELRSYTVD
ncbi:MAG TPA: DUF3293 domain-containing protein [Tahibacter sp.]|uniref:DUF3293 domain-containing protein n=1 Tax=Tahibacter sp. TaxID=2056211 RepID=UPI002CC7FF8E|nr:DUF3293 domain-containing protein [Tahibacter sp.]HSX60009.1 DUF3293 domain-containing protein [Tahibacter sp.]